MASSLAFRSRRLLLTFLLLFSPLLGCRGWIEALQGWLPWGEKRLEQKTRAHSQFVNELYEVVLLIEPENLDAFRAWVHSLNEGASYEGVYSGFTHSAFYRRLERSHPAPKGNLALEFFLDQIEMLRKVSKTEIRFRAEDGWPPEPPSLPGDTRTDPQSKAKVIEFGSSKERVEDRYIFMRSSLYTLKRVLGSEFVRFLERERNRERASFAQWYAKWVVDLNRFGVDLGLQERMIAENEFHRRWAMQADWNRVTWEVLNRVHRVLNYLGGSEKRENS